MHIINIEYDPSFKSILLRSDYFKIWLIEKLPSWNSIKDVEEFLHIMGIDVEDSIIFAAYERKI